MPIQVFRAPAGRGSRLKFLIGSMPQTWPIVKDLAIFYLRKIAPRFLRSLAILHSCNFEMVLTLRVDGIPARRSITCHGLRAAPSSTNSIHLG